MGQVSFFPSVALGAVTALLAAAHAAVQSGARTYRYCTISTLDGSFTGDQPVVQSVPSTDPVVCGRACSATENGNSFCLPFSDPSACSLANIETTGLNAGQSFNIGFEGTCERLSTPRPVTVRISLWAHCPRLSLDDVLLNAPGARKSDLACVTTARLKSWIRSRVMAITGGQHVQPTLYPPLFRHSLNHFKNFLHFSVIYPQHWLSYLHQHNRMIPSVCVICSTFAAAARTAVYTAAIHTLYCHQARHVLVSFFEVTPSAVHQQANMEWYKQV